MKRTYLLAVSLACAIALPAAAQRVYNWTPSNDEMVRLDPGYYHAGPTYQAGPEGKKIHVDIDAQQPVTVAVTSAQGWNDANDRPEMVRRLQFTCIQEQVLKATYDCDVPPSQTVVLVVRDDRGDHGMFAGAGAVVDRHDHDHDRDQDQRQQNADDAIRNAEAMMHGGGKQFFAPNDVHIQYYDWSCVDKCNVPEFHERVFDWVPSSEETVRLDPANYYAGPTYPANGGNMKVEIDARRPVTISMADANGWRSWGPASTTPNPRMVTFSCVQQHALQTTYTCSLPMSPWPDVLIIHDERDFDHDHRAANTPADKPMVVPANNLDGHFAAPNDVHIRYFAWQCVEYCDQPVFQWVSLVSEKYKVQASAPKVYGGITPDHDGDNVSIHVKSPVPMAVALLPSSIANQLYGNPSMLESSVEKSACQQRGVQSSTFKCTVNLADGPQSLVVSPEASAEIPQKKLKKTEVDLQMIHCVTNCDKLPGR